MLQGSLIRERCNASGHESHPTTRLERIAGEPRQNLDPLCEAYPPSLPTRSSARRECEHVTGAEKGATAHNLKIPVDDTQIVHMMQPARDSRNLVSKGSKKSRVQQ